MSVAIARVVQSNSAVRLVRRNAVAPGARLWGAEVRALFEAHAADAPARPGWRPWQVLGGPGTGKTSLLVDLAAERIAAGADPESVLLLTHSKQAARGVRDAITARLAGPDGLDGGVPGATREPLVRTLHSYAFSVLRRHALVHGNPPPRLLTGAEQDAVLREMLRGDLTDIADGNDALWPQRLQPALALGGFAEQLRDLMLRATERGIGPEDLIKLGREHGKSEWVAAGRFAVRYEQAMLLRWSVGVEAPEATAPALDAAELIGAALDALAADANLLAAERNRIRYLLVDDAQQLDPQAALLVRVIGTAAHTAVVAGDPDQAIFTFRGADSSFLADLDVPDERRIILRRNQRSGAAVHLALARVAAKLPASAPHRFTLPNRADEPEDDGATVRVRVLASPAKEAALIADHLRRAHLTHGVPWSRMAVIVRSVPLSLAPLRRALLAAGVPVQQPALDVPLARRRGAAWMLLALRAVLASERSRRAAAEMFTADDALDLLGGPLGGADQITLRRLRRGIRRSVLESQRKPGRQGATDIGDDSAAALSAAGDSFDEELVSEFDWLRSESDWEPGSDSEDVGEAGLGSAADSAPGEDSDGPTVFQAVPAGSGLGADGPELGAAGLGMDADGLGMDAAGLGMDADGARMGDGPELDADGARMGDGPELDAAGLGMGADGPELDADGPWMESDDPGVEADDPGAEADDPDWGSYDPEQWVSESDWYGDDSDWGLEVAEHADDSRRGRPPVVPTEPERRELGPAIDTTDDVAERVMDIAALIELSSAEVLRGLLIGEIDRSIMDKLTDVEARPLRRVLDALDRAAKARKDGAGLEEVMWALWSTSQLERRWVAQSERGGAVGMQADRDLDAAVGLFDAAAAYVDRLPRASIEGFVEYLVQQEIPQDTAPLTAPGEAVALLSAHAAAGREWDVVAVAAVQEGIWPNTRPRGTLLHTEDLVDLTAGIALGEQVSRAAPILAEERRLLLVACSRARRSLLVTAVESVSGERDLVPSRFLAELLGHDDDSEPGVLPIADPGRALVMHSLVAELRGVVCDPESDPERRGRAAHQLARLAQAGVPGTHPEEWYGTNDLSSEDSLWADDDSAVALSPSTVELLRTCPLRWALERHGGTDGDNPHAVKGNLVHTLVQALAGRVPESQVRAALDKAWRAIDPGTGWHSRQELRRTEAMLETFMAWVHNTRGELTQAGVEIPVDCELPARTEAERPVRIRGRVDRLERDALGRFVIVDVKTGKSPITKQAAIDHAQLATYQVAAAMGALDAALGESDSASADSTPPLESATPPGDSGPDHPSDGPDPAQTAEPGGARLVYVAKPSAKEGATQRLQPPLDAEALDQWRTTIHDAAAATRGPSYLAMRNDGCRHCAVAGSCPVQDTGRQVTDE
ncbi:PD-(D/E)XK nuclease family protein [Nocardia goodfellowii]|uniref:PD-(D/E)XK nuclease family protein n=1 Tax=Nocardia goodfellowii TaxID=882446 RepID=UPI003557102D